MNKINVQKEIKDLLNLFKRFKREKHKNNDKSMLMVITMYKDIIYDINKMNGGGDM